MATAPTTISLLTREDLANLSVVYGKQNVLPWEIYDTVDVANAQTLTSIPFFSNTRGGQGIAITNLEQPNQLISQKAFVLEEILLDVSVPTYVAGTLADFVTLTSQKSSFTLKINQAEYAQGLVKDLIGGGFFGFGTPATNVAYLAPRNGVRGYKLATPIVIPTQMQFSLQFDYAAAPSPAATVTLRPKLCGKLIRLTSA
jgi:hypothetical protein